MYCNYNTNLILEVPHFLRELPRHRKPSRGFDQFKPISTILSRHLMFFSIVKVLDFLETVLPLIKFPRTASHPLFIWAGRFWASKIGGTPNLISSCDLPCLATKGLIAVLHSQAFRSSPSSYRPVLPTETYATATRG